jgi:hypothetical protein
VERSTRSLSPNCTHSTKRGLTDFIFSLSLHQSHPYHYIIHDRDAIFSSGLDTALKSFGVRVLKTPVRAPKPNAFCERLIGTIRSLMTSNAECENRAAGYLSPTTGEGERG